MLFALAFMVLFVPLPLPAQAQDSSPQTARENPPAKKADPTKPVITSISPTEFQIGLVTLDKKTRSIRFPAEINMDANLIEYVCDGGNNKLHECLLKTEANALHIHLAALLLSDPAANKGTSTNENSAPVSIRVSWKNGPEMKSVALEEMIAKRDPASKKESEMPPDQWIYNDTGLDAKRFQAHNSGIIIALIEDASALISTTDRDKANDEVWFVNQQKCPPVATPVEVTLQFKPSESKL